MQFEEMKNQIVCGDCLEVMKDIPNKSIDLILSDYPFNCQDGKKDYESFIERTEKEFSRIAKDVCNLIVINSPAKIFTTSKFFQDWKLVNGIALVRKGTFGCPQHFRFQHNYALILNKGGIKNKWNGTQSHTDKEFMTDVVQYQNGYRGKGIGNWHPQALPMALVEKLIEYLSDENDIVLDPFMGSGTTAVACKKLNRNYIGIEFLDKYCEMANKRLFNLCDTL